MITAKKKIFAISGSTRRHSSNESILQHIAKTNSDTLEVEIYDGIDKLPHFNSAVKETDISSTVKDFRKKIEASDAVIICTPEYVFSLPGSLKNAIEWNVATTVFSRKPVAIIVASASGEKAFESLELVMTTLEAMIPEEAKLLIKGVKGKIGADGVLNDQKTIDAVEILVKSLVMSIKDVINK